MTYRVGIVGSGFGGAVHAPAYRLHPDFEPVALASPNRAEAVARERGIPHAFADVEAMLAGVELDVVSIASPPFDHARTLRAALRAGKAVLCEKPLAVRLDEAEAMAAEVRAAGVPSAVAFEFRYGSAQIAIHELIANGHLGALREIEVAQYLPILRQAAERPRGWFTTRASGGGVANGFSPHQIDLACWYTGRAPVAVHGMLRTANAQRRDAAGAYASDTADGAFAILDFGDGLVARLTIDATLTISQATVAVHGEERSAVGTGPALAALDLYTLEPDDQSELELAPQPYVKHAMIHPNLPCFLGLLDAFAARLRGEPSDAPTFEDGLRAQRVLAAIGYGTTG